MVSVLKSFLIPVRWLAPAYRMVRQLAGVRPDLRETIYQLEHFGYQSILIVIAAGCAVGGIVAVHADLRHQLQRRRARRLGGRVRDAARGRPPADRAPARWTRRRHERRSSPT